MKFQILIFAAIFIFAAVSFSAQVAPVNAEVQKDDKEGIYLFKTENGYLYVFNLEKDAYQIELKGIKLEYLDKHVALTFYIDNKFTDLLFVLNKNYWEPKTKVKKNPTEEEFLEAHKIWESDYFSNRYKAKLSVSSEILNLESGRKVMYWSFLMPEQLGSAFSHRNYLITVVGKNVIGITGAAKTAADEKAVRDYLIETMNTLKVSDKPFNIKELRLLHKELKFGEDNL